ncbi:MAG: hypothetical protein M3M88_05795 [Thermoproteota archaeon]|nr:hypothetical protein [Thermoproteota archaeon]
MLSIGAEFIAGIAIVGLGVLFLIGGLLNPVWALIIPVDFVIIAIGVATLGLGIWSSIYEKKHSMHSKHH